MGYATFPDRPGEESDDELAKQADVIARACAQRGLVLVEMVGDPHLDYGPVRPRLSGARPGLRYALDRIAAGEAQGLVVPGLRRLTRSVAELGPIVDWCMSRNARLVAVAQGFDTGEPESRIAARLIIEVSRWERERLSESLGEGQSLSRGGLRRPSSTMIPTCSVAAGVSGHDGATDTLAGLGRRCWWPSSSRR